MTTQKNASLIGLALAAALLSAVAAAAPAAAQDGGSYGFIRVLEGPATVVQAGNRDTSNAEVNLPVLAGDRITVPSRSRLEVVLADLNLLRVDGGSDLVLAKLAESPDADDRRTVVRLEEGNLQLVVSGASRADLPQIETPSATISVRREGVYRVTADRDWTEVVVREGLAEVETDDDAALVRAQEAAFIDGGNRGAIEVDSATSRDALERWAERLDAEYDDDDTRYVDRDLRYASSSMSRYGSWITISSRPYWRPTVASGWRPYWHGRWVYTPAGLTWVSYEPWGWVPYHYGSWDYIPGYGWVWEPGYVWSPAWVYWYWGPSHVGWCPTGYYTRFYGGHFGHGFRHGVYGWASGHWGFDHWTFVGSDYFRGYHHGYRDGFRDGRRSADWDVQRYAVPVDKLPRLGQGIITTDTRPLRPETWAEPAVAIRALSDRPGNPGIPGKGPLQLPDVTSFVARKPQLPDAVSRWVAADAGQQLDGTPLKPSTLGRKPAATAPDASWHEGRRPGKPAIEIGDNVHLGDNVQRGDSARQREKEPQPQGDALSDQPAVRPAPKPTTPEQPGTDKAPPVVDRWSLPRVEPPSGRKPQPTGGGSESGGTSEGGGDAWQARPKPQGDRGGSSGGTSPRPVYQPKPSTQPSPPAERHAPRPSTGDSGGGSGKPSTWTPAPRPAPSPPRESAAPAPKPAPDRSWSKPAPSGGSGGSGSTGSSSSGSSDNQSKPREAKPKPKPPADKDRN